MIVTTAQRIHGKNRVQATYRGAIDGATAAKNTPNTSANNAAPAVCPIGVAIPKNNVAISTAAAAISPRRDPNPRARINAAITKNRNKPSSHGTASWSGAFSCETEPARPNPPREANTLAVNVKKAHQTATTRSRTIHGSMRDHQRPTPETEREIAAHTRILRIRGSLGQLQHRPG